MKVRILILLSIAAIVTLSFSFTSVNVRDKKVQDVSTVHSNDNEPIGGFVSDEK